MKNRYVSFRLGTVRFCIPVAAVQQILRHENIIEIPKAPPFVEGVVNLRGDIVPVINLKKRLSLPEPENRNVAMNDRERNVAMSDRRESRKERIIVAQAGSRRCGLAVDEVREVVEIEDSLFLPQERPSSRESAECIRGSATQGGATVLLVDLISVIGASRDTRAEESR
jgi:purine-binding chemotaxis protein CheW